MTKTTNKSHKGKRNSFPKNKSRKIRHVSKARDDFGRFIVSVHRFIVSVPRPISVNPCLWKDRQEIKDEIIPTPIIVISDSEEDIESDENSSDEEVIVMDSTTALWPSNVNVISANINEDLYTFHTEDFGYCARSDGICSSQSCVNWQSNILCSATTCKFEVCSNRFEENPNIQLMTGVNGIGVRTTADIDEDEFIVEYVGEMVTLEELVYDDAGNKNIFFGKSNSPP